MRPTAVVLALLAVTACGGDSDTTPQATPSAAPTAPPVSLPGTVTDRGTRAVMGAKDVAIVAGDSFFSPTFLRGSPGATVTVSLASRGAAPHTFTIDAPKVDVKLDAGGRGTATVTIPAGGAVAFYCRFHRAQGMQGAFYSGPGGVTVTPGASSSGDGGAYEK